MSETKKGLDGFIRDQSNPGAVLNIDNNSLDAYKKKKNKYKEIDSVAKDIAGLKSEMAQLKEMINTILRAVNQNK